MAVSSKNIHVGWIQGTDGYVKHKTVDDANTYEVLNPGTVSYTHLTLPTKRIV